MNLFYDGGSYASVYGRRAVTALVDSNVFAILPLPSWQLIAAPVVYMWRRARRR
jgi:hypothetical protein